MPFSWAVPAVVSTIGGIIGGSEQADAAREAARTQADAARYAADQQKAMFDTLNKQQAAGRGAGYSSLNTIRSLLPGAYTQYDENGNPIGTATGTDYLTRQFTPADFAANLDPGYAFRLSQGQGATNALANAAGGLLSGNTLRGLQDYTQTSASNEYSNAFDRFQRQRTNIYNTLAGIAGLGQNAQGQTNQLGQNYINAATGLGTGAAASEAAGTIGAANAKAGMYGNIGNNVMLASLLRGNQPSAVPFQALANPGVPSAGSSYDPYNYAT